MAEYSFIPDAGTKIKEIEPAGSHTAAQSNEKGETDSPMKNSEAAARLEQILKDFGFSVSRLNLEVEKDCVQISGSVSDQETREKVILTVGNIQGVAKVEESLQVSKPGAESRFYTVEKADSLQTISEKVFKDRGRTASLLAANATLLKGEKDLYPGMVIRIPAELQK